MNEPIIDTHQHLWDLSKQSYSWCAGIPALNRSFVMSDYLSAAAGLNVVASVHVEADVDEPDMARETRWLLEQVRDPANPLKALVIQARPENDDFSKYLEQFAGEDAIKGIRRVLHTQPDEQSQSAKFRENLRKLPAMNYTFDLCVLARQLPVAIELVKSCPSVSFILDHCGVPDVKGQALDPWHAHISELAKLPNVIACKISGLVAYADSKTWTVNDLRPFVDHVVSSFGYDRIMFGSDWPVCTLSATFAHWVNAAQELTSNWSAGERRKFFSGNANRVYRLA